jgi:predicted nucleic acid-binding protein
LIDCLDSWAILSWLNGEGSGAERVDASLKTRPVMSWINLGEVAYVLERRTSAREAQQVVRALRPQLVLDLPSETRVLAASSLKARFRIAYADAFAIATAIAHGATLLTGNPEIVNGDPNWPVEDLR